MKDTIIIVEGPQGVGKTSVTNYLREKIVSADLYRLTGIKDKTPTGYDKIKRKYLKLLEYVENCEDVNMVFDRTFFSFYSIIYIMGAYLAPISISFYIRNYICFQNQSKLLSRLFLL